ncbi:unnamed protein product [Mycena citricolor]|uniref:SH3 domain-containing protein n=1 Tax=Mycena citricolor TaxID=2018698 RepID=A0AAD2HV69_9AGAR|nr:unnamed protein product [Mycena citricolor]CAK5282748.1 unnamed protein product [Mycena citricolor]
MATGSQPLLTSHWHLPSQSTHAAHRNRPRRSSAMTTTTKAKTPLRLDENALLHPVLVQSPVSPTPTATSNPIGSDFRATGTTPILQQGSSATGLPSAGGSTPTPLSAKRVSFPPPPSSAPRTPTTPTGFGELLSSTRPAPSSPGLSRRTSLARSSSSASVRSGSASASHSRRTSKVLAGVRHRLSQSISAADVTGVATASMPADGAGAADDLVVTVASSPEGMPGSAQAIAARRAPIVIRDFAFDGKDPRHAGQGPDVPRLNDPRVLRRRLLGESRQSDYGPGEDDVDIDEDEDGVDNGWGGLGRFGLWGTVGSSSGSGSLPSPRPDVSSADLARNFAADDENDDEPYDDYADVPVPPGLYQAQFAFEPEDTSEMSLVEGQIVRVVESSGAGAGWAVAIARTPPLLIPDMDLLALNRLVGAREDAGAMWGELWEQYVGQPNKTEPGPDRRALAPESFLVCIRRDGELEDGGAERLAAYLEWVEQERARQEAEDAGHQDELNAEHA